jgi:AcrR family transcriptional regulator
MTSVPSTARLPAHERRQAIVEAATAVFSSGSYSAATTAQIAAAAGISEPILYRHFRSKRELYFACLDDAWAQLKAVLEQKLQDVREPQALRVMFQTGTGFRELKARIPNLWVQAITEAGRDEEIRRHLRRHMRDVHDFMSGVLRRAQEAGAIPADRDPDAEAWIMIAGGLLVAIADRVGGVLTHDDFTRIAAQRKRWLLGLDES